MPASYYKTWVPNVQGVLFFHGVLGKRSCVFDPDVVLVVYIIAHAWVKFTAHGQLVLHIL